MPNIHFISIGGAAMHNLAIALKLNGYNVSGTDDEIFDPAKSRLHKYGLLPETIGWDTEKITENLDAVILGMHARKDNPELLKAQELGLKIYSFPEFLYEQSKNKIRIVIGGSHGKTSITAMILHVLKENNIACDYMVGAQLAGFEVMVKLTNDAPFMVLEGDEYLTSPIDRRPKFHVYKPDIALINGIAWDHINVFPTFPIYVEQFKIFADEITPNGCLIYYSNDEEVNNIATHARPDITKIPYNLPEYTIDNGITTVVFNGKTYPLQVFGKHNLQNICGAWEVCKRAGISDEQFLMAIQSFAGASKRLELVAKSDTSAMYKDFAHSPSKLNATVTAVKEQFPNRTLVACMELHTFSSLTQEFLNEYKGAFGAADEAIVYFNPHTIAHKKLPELTIETVKKAFAREDIIVFNDSEKLQHHLLEKPWKNTNLLLMSSGNFDGLNEVAFAKKLLTKHSIYQQ
ncbi:MAG: Mur ligase domain-containing protein [Bacteroidales bacterium]|jgi:UDP-N-acetylmuramate: L-alanyl-gamma-D-glutamyl-meso-diaminopimelate ligase|nr:Mur ligase domain-containing protein [Bacteroidales bacterium]